jgi:hypothetical protein
VKGVALALIALPHAASAQEPEIIVTGHGLDAAIGDAA